MLGSTVAELGVRGFIIEPSRDESGLLRLFLFDDMCDRAFWLGLVRFSLPIRLFRAPRCMDLLIDKQQVLAG